MKEMISVISFLPKEKCHEIETSSKRKNSQHIPVEWDTEPKKTWFQWRYSIIIVGFFIYSFINTYRINVSVTLVAMVNSSALQLQTESESCPELLEYTSNNSKNEDNSEEGEFDWPPEIQGYILGSYYLIYMIVQIPVGKLVETYGCKWFLFWGTIMAAVATLAIPFASRLHAYGFIVVQLIRGIGQGVYQPAGSVLIVNWLPKMERGPIYAIMQSGTALGACLGSIFSGLLCKSNILGGWPASFYAFGFAGLALAAVIALFIHESPDVHPKISQSELKYILSNQERALSRKRPNVPWGKILRSVPVYGLTIGFFGQLWAMSQFLIVQATFLGTILHYPIKQNGFFTAVPFILMFFFTLISSSISSVLTKRGYASINQVRKFWNFASCVGFSACLLGVYFAGCERSWSMIFSILSVGFMGFGMSGTWIVSADMSPTFAASLNAICCSFGCLPTFILPLVVGYLTNEMQTIEQWNKVFFLSIGVVMTSGIIFQLLGSAEIQPWNDVEDEPEYNEKRTKY